MSARDYVTVEQVRSGLRALYRADAEINLQAALLRSLADELQPVNTKGRWKPSPFLALLAALACVLVGIFVYFTLGGQG
jgi:hypothetical protein